ncbi:MAG TPA: C4-dicarboxylate ABC transporter substrate-binding protein, partial [Marinobacter sp.]|nr:C4-dicarboxylate ABC transporter substrate-binding protein [Marinobacter sp.]
MQKSTKLPRQHVASARYMKRIGGVLTAAALTLAVGSAQATEWDMPTPYGDSNFHTVN